MRPLGGSPVPTTRSNPASKCLLCVILCLFPALANPIEFLHMVAGNHMDFGFSVTRDQEGFIYTAGVTSSSDFPTTPGVYQPEPVEGPNAFVQKLSPDGSQVVYSTYLGPVVDQVRAISIEVDATGCLYAAVNAFNKQTDALVLERLGEVVVYKLSADGDQLVYSARILPRPGYTDPVLLDVDEAGAAYIAASGPGIHVRKLDPAGTRIEYQYAIERTARSRGALGDIEVSADGSLYIVGITEDPNFPITAGAFSRRSQSPELGDVFLVRLDPSGADRILSTTFGGDSREDRPSLALDAAGNIYVAGQTTVSTQGTGRMEGNVLGFPEPTYGRLGFILKLDSAASNLVYSVITPTRLGAIGVDGFGNAYAVGFGDGGASSPGAIDRGFTCLKLNTSGTEFSYYADIPAATAEAYDMDVTEDGSAVLAGSTTSIGIPDAGPPLRVLSNAVFAWIAKEPPAANLQVEALITHRQSGAGGAASRDNMDC